MFGQGTAVKFNFFLGVLVVLFLLLTARTLEKYLELGGLVPGQGFSGRRAYADLERFVSFGPRAPGMPGHAEAQELIREGLEGAKLGLRSHGTTVESAGGAVKLKNLIGVVRGSEPGVILICTHYDSRFVEDSSFADPCESAAASAVLLELARCFGETRKGRTLWLAFFDGEEGLPRETARKRLRGVEAFVARLKKDGTLYNVQAVICLGMVGDCALGIERDAKAPGWLVEAIWNKAADLEATEQFTDEQAYFRGSHLPFGEAGVPAVFVGDPLLGATQAEDLARRHASADTLDGACQDSLQAVGDVIYHALLEIEARLDAP